MSNTKGMFDGQHSIGARSVLRILGARGTCLRILLLVQVLSAGVSRQASAEPARVANSASQGLSVPVAVDTNTPYPPLGSGEARVVVELLIGVDGKVLEWEIVRGDEPFVQAVRDSVDGYSFEPARRDGVPVSSKIRLQIAFQQPKLRVVSEGEPPASTRSGVNSSTNPGDPESAGPVSSSSPTAEREIEVFVLGHTDAGAQTLSDAEVRVLPGAFGDPFRAISTLPGVAPLVTGLPVQYVRGSPPGNVGFFVDSIRLPLLFHAFLGPAVVHPRLLQRVQLYSGAYPAEIGRFAGGVVQAQLASSTAEPFAEATVRLVDAGGYLETPFSDGRGRLVLAGRYSYTAWLLSRFSDLDLRYWDYQALASYQLSRSDRLRVVALGALDAANSSGGSPDTGLGGDSNEVAFHRVELRYDKTFGEASRASVSASFGRDNTQGSRGAATDRVRGLRVGVVSQLAPSVRLRAGASAYQDKYRLQLQSDTSGLLDVLTLFPSRVDRVMGGHVDLVVDASSRFQWVPGVRVDRFESGGDSRWAVSPRLALRTALTASLTAEQALGVAHQTPNYVPAIPGVAVAGFDGGLQRSYQASASLEKELSELVQLKWAVFYNATFNLTDPFGLNQDLALDAEQAKIRSLGRNFGAEWSVHRRFAGGVGAMLNYTLSRSLRSYGVVSTPSGYDRPHVLNAALTKSLGGGWTAGVRGLYYSGVGGSRRVTGTAKVFDQSRARPFFRLDGRVEKEFLLDSGAKWQVVAEVLNASLSREVLRRNCAVQCQDEEVGPLFLPSLGVTGQL